MEMRQQQEQVQECAPSIGERLLHVIDQWETSLTFFCLVFGFFLGLVLIVNPFHRLLQRDSSYLIYGTFGMILVGLCYVGLTVYAALYPERHGGYTAIAVIAGTGLYASIRDGDVVGIGFWTLALITVAISVVRRLRAIERGERP